MIDEVDAGRLPSARPWVVVLACYLLSRVLVLAATGVTDTLRLSGPRCGDEVARPIEGFAALARCWDTRWYLRAALEGYPASLPATGNGQSTFAFFPGYPGVVAAVHRLGIPALGAAIGVALIAGAVATLLVWRLGLSVASPEAALRAAVLFAVFPGAVVLSWGYSEALATATAASALLFLHQRRWLGAGVAAGLAGTTRGDVWLAVTVAAVVAAGLALRGEGDRRALLAPVLAPLGGLAYIGFVWWRTGTPLTWLRTQSRGWDQHLDWGTHARRTIGGVLSDPFATPSRVVEVFAVVFMVGAVVALGRRPVPLPWLAYAGVLLAISLTSSQVGFRPRAELLLLPAFVAAGAWLSGRAMTWVVPILATAQALLVILWLGAPLIVPP